MRPPKTRGWMATTQEENKKCKSRYNQFTSPIFEFHALLSYTYGLCRRNNIKCTNCTFLRMGKIQSQLHVNGGHKKLFSMALRSCCCRFNNLATLDAASFTSSDEEQQQQQVNRPSPTKLHTNGTV